MADFVPDPRLDPSSPPLPAVTVIPISRGRVLVYLVGCSMMALAGWAVPRSGGVTSDIWGGGFFSLCSLAFLVMLLPGAGRLVLTSDAVTMRFFYREHRFAWRQMTRPVAKGLIPYIPAWLIGRAMIAETVSVGPTVAGKPSKRRKIAIPLSMYGSYQEIVQTMVAYWQQAQSASSSAATLDLTGSKD